MTLKPDSLRQTADAIEAWAAQKPCQQRQIGSATWNDMVTGVHYISRLNDWEYRPTPEPPLRVLRPWKREEVPLGAEITSKISGNRYIIIGAEPSFVFLGIGAMLCEQVLSDFTLANGDPCGTYET